MAFPDRIERTVDISRPPADVWSALTTADGLAAWFGQEAKIDLRPGGAASMGWDGGHHTEMRVERVEEPAVFGFKTGFAQLPDDVRRTEYDEHTKGWAAELGELVDYLAA